MTQNTSGEAWMELIAITHPFWLAVEVKSVNGLHCSAPEPHRDPVPSKSAFNCRPIRYNRILISSESFLLSRPLISTVSCFPNRRHDLMLCS